MVTFKTVSNKNVRWVSGGEEGQKREEGSFLKPGKGIWVKLQANCFKYQKHPQNLTDCQMESYQDPNT